MPLNIEPFRKGSFKHALKWVTGALAAFSAVEISSAVLGRRSSSEWSWSGEGLGLATAPSIGSNYSSLFNWGSISSEAIKSPGGVYSGTHLRGGYPREMLTSCPLSWTLSAATVSEATPSAPSSITLTATVNQPVVSCVSGSIDFSVSPFDSTKGIVCAPVTCASPGNTYASSNSNNGLQVYPFPFILKPTDYVYGNGSILLIITGTSSAGPSITAFWSINVNKVPIPPTLTPASLGVLNPLTIFPGQNTSTDLPTGFITNPNNDGYASTAPSSNPALLAASVINSATGNYAPVSGAQTALQPGGLPYTATFQVATVAGSVNFTQSVIVGNRAPPGGSISIPTAIPFGTPLSAIVPLPQSGNPSTPVQDLDGVIPEVCRGVPVTCAVTVLSPVGATFNNQTGALFYNPSTPPPAGGSTTVTFILAVTDRVGAVGLLQGVTSFLSTLNLGFNSATHTLTQGLPVPLSTWFNLNSARVGAVITFTPSANDPTVVITPATTIPGITLSAGPTAVGSAAAVNAWLAASTVTAVTQDLFSLTGSVVNDTGETDTHSTSPLVITPTAYPFQATSQPVSAQVANPGVAAVFSATPGIQFINKNPVMATIARVRIYTQSGALVVDTNTTPSSPGVWNGWGVSGVNQTAVSTAASIPLQVPITAPWVSENPALNPYSVILTVGGTGIPSLDLTTSLTEPSPALSLPTESIPAQGVGDTPLPIQLPIPNTGGDPVTPDIPNLPVGWSFNSTNWQVKPSTSIAETVVLQLNVVRVNNPASTATQSYSVTITPTLTGVVVSPLVAYVEDGPPVHVGLGVTCEPGRILSATITNNSPGTGTLAVPASAGATVDCTGGSVCHVDGSCAVVAPLLQNNVTLAPATHSSAPTSVSFLVTDGPNVPATGNVFLTGTAVDTAMVVSNQTAVNSIVCYPTQSTSSFNSVVVQNFDSQKSVVITTAIYNLDGTVASGFDIINGPTLITGGSNYQAAFSFTPQRDTQGSGQKIYYAQSKAVRSDGVVVYGPTIPVSVNNQSPVINGQVGNIELYANRSYSLLWPSATSPTGATLTPQVSLRDGTQLAVPTLDAVGNYYSNGTAPVTADSTQLTFAYGDNHGGFTSLAPVNVAVSNAMTITFLVADPSSGFSFNENQQNVTMPGFDCDYPDVSGTEHLSVDIACPTAMGAANINLALAASLGVSVSPVHVVGATKVVTVSGLKNNVNTLTSMGCPLSVNANVFTTTTPFQITVTPYNGVDPRVTGTLSTTINQVQLPLQMTALEPQSCVQGNCKMTVPAGIGTNPNPGGTLNLVAGPLPDPCVIYQEPTHTYDLSGCAAPRDYQLEPTEEDNLGATVSTPWVITVNPPAGSGVASLYETLRPALPYIGTFGGIGILVLIALLRRSGQRPWKEAHRLLLDSKTRILVPHYGAYKEIQDARIIKKSDIETHLRNLMDEVISAEGGRPEVATDVAQFLDYVILYGVSHFDDRDTEDGLEIEVNKAITQLAELVNKAKPITLLDSDKVIRKREHIVMLFTALQVFNSLVFAGRDRKVDIAKKLNHINALIESSGIKDNRNERLKRRCCGQNDYSSFDTDDTFLDRSTNLRARMRSALAVISCLPSDNSSGAEIGRFLKLSMASMLFQLGCSGAVSSSTVFEPKPRLWGKQAESAMYLGLFALFDVDAANKLKDEYLKCSMEPSLVRIYRDALDRVARESLNPRIQVIAHNALIKKREQVSKIDIKSSSPKVSKSVIIIREGALFSVAVVNKLKEDYLACSFDDPIQIKLYRDELRRVNRFGVSPAIRAVAVAALQEKVEQLKTVSSSVNPEVVRSREIIAEVRVPGILPSSESAAAPETKAVARPSVNPYGFYAGAAVGARGARSSQTSTARVIPPLHSTLPLHLRAPKPATSVDASVGSSSSSDAASASTFGAGKASDSEDSTHDTSSDVSRTDSATDSDSSSVESDSKASSDASPSSGSESGANTRYRPSNSRFLGADVGARLRATPVRVVLTPAGIASSASAAAPRLSLVPTPAGAGVGPGVVARVPRASPLFIGSRTSEAARARTSLGGAGNDAGLAGRRQSRSSMAGGLLTAGVVRRTSNPVLSAASPSAASETVRVSVNPIGR